MMIESEHIAVLDLIQNSRKLVISLGPCKRWISVLLIYVMCNLSFHIPGQEIASNIDLAAIDLMKKKEPHVHC